MTVNCVQNLPLVENEQSGYPLPAYGREANYSKIAVRTFGASTFTVRRPRFGDFERWRATRLAHAGFLSPAFGEADRTWAEVNSPSAWVEKYLTDRRLFRHGLSYPHVLVETAKSKASVVGEVNISRVDVLSSAGELSVWCTPSTHHSEVTGWAGHSMVYGAFTWTNPLRWIIAPVSVANPRPAKGLELAGFEKSATLRRQRDYSGQPTDHDLWICENTFRSRTRLQELMEQA